MTYLDAMQGVKGMKYHAACCTPYMTTKAVSATNNCIASDSSWALGVSKCAPSFQPDELGYESVYLRDKHAKKVILFRISVQHEL
jgi:hypothetical protein